MKIVVNIKASLIIKIDKELVYIIIKMEIYILENGFQIHFKEKVSFHLIGIYIFASGERYMG